MAIQSKFLLFPYTCIKLKENLFNSIQFCFIHNDISDVSLSRLFTQSNVNERQVLFDLTGRVTDRVGRPATKKRSKKGARKT